MMSQVKAPFEIGQTVYRSDFDRRERRIVCPDCLGSKRVKVVLADETEISIECGGCDPGGCEPSRGYLLQWDYAVQTRKHTVSTVTTKAEGPTEYRLDLSNGRAYIGDDTNTFGTEEEALAYGETLRAKAEDEANTRALAKTRDEKSWKWNYAYHKRAAEQARRDLAWHEAKAIVCKAKVKNPTE